MQVNDIHFIPICSEYHKQKLVKHKKKYKHKKYILSESAYFVAFNNYIVALDQIAEIAKINYVTYFDNFILLLIDLRLSLQMVNHKEQIIEDYFDSFLVQLGNSISTKDKYFDIILKSSGIKFQYRFLNFFATKINYSSLFDINIIQHIESFKKKILLFGGYNKEFGYETSTQIRLQNVFRSILNCEINNF